MEPGPGDDKPHVPAPIAAGRSRFAIGLVDRPRRPDHQQLDRGRGSAPSIAFAFGGLWIRDLSSAAGPTRAGAAASDPRSRPAASASAATERRRSRDGRALPARASFLEGATLGLGAVIGARRHHPAARASRRVRLRGPELQERQPRRRSRTSRVGKFIITTFVEDPEAGRGLAAHRLHPLQRLPRRASRASRSSRTTARTSAARCSRTGPVDTNRKKEVKDKQGNVVLSLTPVQPAGFGCPCHGGQYDTEGNRTAGPPVRALDRYTYSIVRRAPDPRQRLQRRQGRGHGQGRRDQEVRGCQFPGQHVDGPEFWLWPVPEIRT